MGWFSISDYKLISYSDFFTDCPTLKYNNSQVKHVELSIGGLIFTPALKYVGVISPIPYTLVSLDYQLCIHICWLILFFQGNNWEKLIFLITQEIKLKDHTSQKNKMSTFCDYITNQGVVLN